MNKPRNDDNQGKTDDETVVQRQFLHARNPKSFGLSRRLAEYMGDEEPAQMI